LSMASASLKDMRVLFIRFGAIGNAVAASPAIRALRKAMPEAYTAVLADPLTAGLWQGCPYLDEVIIYDQKGEHKGLPGYLRLILGIRRKGFTHAIHFRRFTRSELIGFLAGIPERIGFDSEARFQLLTKKVPYQEGVSVIELNLGLVRELGIKADDARLDNWHHDTSDRVRKILDSLEGNGPVIVIHPGGGTQRERLWPYYGELAAALKQEHDARIILVGTPSEAEVIGMTEEKIPGHVEKALGYSLKELLELIRGAQVFVGTDSGPCHLAAMAGTPGAILYAPHQSIAAQVAKWKPGGDQYLAFSPKRDCADCPQYPCPLKRQRECAASIPVDEVKRGIEKLLSS
jgi:heptosyltransferase-2